MKKLLCISAVILLYACNSKEDLSVLTPPSDIEIEQTGLHSVRLSWDVESSYDGTIIERSLVDDHQDYVVIAELGRNELSFEDMSLEKEGRYIYRLSTFRKSEHSNYQKVSFRYRMLPAPTELNGAITDEGLLLSWKDNCKGEDGYVIKRRIDSDEFQDWKNLGPDVTSVLDEDFTSGEYEYLIYAFYGEFRSEEVTYHIDNYYAPKLALGPIQSSWHQVFCPILVNDDGGYDCQVGFCWKTDGSKGAIIGDNNYAFPYSVVTDDICFATADELETGRTYSFRPWVKYDDKIKYFSEVTGELQKEPEPLVAEWKEISSQFDMPESIRLYSAHTGVTGNWIDAWYAVADMSGGDIEFRTFSSESLMKPSEMVREMKNVYLLVNGGAFDGVMSDSYILNNGVEESQGLKKVKRTFCIDENGTLASRTYNVTRGAFGVDADQKPSVKWLFGSRELAYDKPLPSYVSGPVIGPNQNYPSARHEWDVHSAIGGGPVILDDGHMCFDDLIIRDKGDKGYFVSDVELFGTEVFAPNSYTSRTAVGHTADGKIVIMVVEGVSLGELAQLMKGVGCTDALNLDGGASSVMCVTPDGIVLNAPSAGHEIPVLSYVALVGR